MRVLLPIDPIDDIHRLRTAWGICTVVRHRLHQGPLCCLPLSFNMTAVALSLSRHQDLDRPATSWSRFELELPLPKR